MSLEGALSLGGCLGSLFLNQTSFILTAQGVHLQQDQQCQAEPGNSLYSMDSHGWSSELSCLFLLGLSSVAPSVVPRVQKVPLRRVPLQTLTLDPYQFTLARETALLTIIV